jgi:hypothetical protein
MVTSARPRGDLLEAPSAELTESGRSKPRATYTPPRRVTMTVLSGPCRGEKGLQRVPVGADRLVRQVVCGIARWSVQLPSRTPADSSGSLT